MSNKPFSPQLAFFWSWFIIAIVTPTKRDTNSGLPPGSDVCCKHYVAFVSSGLKKAHVSLTVLFLSIMCERLCVCISLYDVHVCICVHIICVCSYECGHVLAMAHVWRTEDNFEF